MVRGKDKIWEHAEELEEQNKWKCIFCERVFSGGASRFKSHLSGVTGRDINICEKVNHETQAYAFLALSRGSKKSKSSMTDSPSFCNTDDQEEDQHESASIKSGLRCQSQGSLVQMKKKKDKDFVDKMLAKHFIVNNISFNVIQTTAFCEFAKVALDYGPAYKIPSYSTLRAKLIPESRMSVDEYVAMVKQSWVSTGCTIMSDIWTDLMHRSFINLISYSPSGAVFMKSLDVSRERKIGIFLKEIISSVIELIGHEHVVQFISDNGSNFTSAGDLLIGMYPRMYKTRCAAHGIQLLLKDIYDEVYWVKVVTDEARLVVIFMTKYTIIHATMKEYTKARQLRQPCATRFASNFLMLQSVLDLENELRLFVASSEWRGFDYCKIEVGKRVTDIIQSDFWDRGRGVISVIEPLIRVLRLVDGDGSSAGYLYEAMTRAKNAIKERCNNDTSKYEHIFELFENCRANNIIHPIHAVAALLNPAYFCSEHFREDREMKDGITYMHENLVLEEEKLPFLREMQLYRTRPATLFTSTAKNMFATSHPRVW